MTITLSTPSGSVPIGPGMEVSVSTDLIGPIGADWYWQAVIRLPSAGPALTTAQKQAHGARSLSMTWNVDLEAPFAQLNRPAQGLAAGSSVEVFVRLVQSNFFTVEDSGTFSGFTWDPYTGLGWLLQRLVVSGGDIDQILAAVVRTFPAP